MCCLTGNARISGRIGMIGENVADKSCAVSRETQRAFIYMTARLPRNVTRKCDIKVSRWIPAFFIIYSCNRRCQNLFTLDTLVFSFFFLPSNFKVHISIADSAKDAKLQCFENDRMLAIRIRNKKQKYSSQDFNFILYNFRLKHFLVSFVLFEMFERFHLSRTYCCTVTYEIISTL